MCDVYTLCSVRYDVDNLRCIEGYESCEGIVVRNMWCVDCGVRSEACGVLCVECGELSVNCDECFLVWYPVCYKLCGL